MPRYIFYFTPSQLDFRLSELESVARLFNVSLEYISDVRNVETPFWVIEASDEQSVRKMGSRLVLVKGIYEYWGEGGDYEELQKNVLDVHKAYKDIKNSYKFSLVCINQTISNTQRFKLIESFSWMDFQGRIDLKTPDVDVTLLQENEVVKELSHLPRDKESLGVIKKVYIGRKICEGQRNLVDHFSLKKREYVGNTSMEAEISLLMANAALCSENKLVYDPFVGTGSMLHTCAYFGAWVMGSDIDGRQIRGKKKDTKEISIMGAAKQYGVQDKVFDFLTMDLTNRSWRDGAFEGLFDAIVTDPPYGVRAGAKRLGRDENSTRTDTVQAYVMTDGRQAHLLDDYIAPTQAWEMSDVIEGLLDLSAQYLKVGGRLVYFLPTTEESEEHVPSHPLLRVISTSTQSFGRWARKLVTMERLSEQDRVTNDSKHSTQGHVNFRERYFKIAE